VDLVVVVASVVVVVVAVTEDEEEVALVAGADEGASVEGEGVEASEGAGVATKLYENENNKNICV
jgi:hypothetical protein